jgi:hypothetical protein
MAPLEPSSRGPDNENNSIAERLAACSTSDSTGALLQHYQAFALV